MKASVLRSGKERRIWKLACARSSSSEMALRVRLVVLGLADGDDAVEHRRARRERHQVLVGAQAQVAPGGHAVETVLEEELRPHLQAAPVEALGVARVELLDVETQLGGEHCLVRDGHGPSDIGDSAALRHRRARS
jgi:hypothetical protein